jgi:hypothetical protein
MIERSGDEIAVQAAASLELAEDIEQRTLAPLAVCLFG